MELIKTIKRLLRSQPQPEETMEQKLEAYRKAGAVIGQNCAIYSPVGG